MKLLTAPASPFGRKVKIAAIERDLIDRIELVMVNTTPLASDANLARDNPLIKIPTLIIDGGIALYDSLVICDYFDSLHGAEKLIPTGGRRWEVLRLHALANGMADAAVLTRYETVLRPEALRWPDWKAGQMKKIIGGLDWLEANVAAIGDALVQSPNLGQIAVGCALGYLDFRFADLDWRGNRAHLAAWFKTFSTRESMQRTMPSA
jgi:glutathione S-transferase